MDFPVGKGFVHVIFRNNNSLISSRSSAEAPQQNAYNYISGRVDKACATEVVDSGSIPGRVMPKTIKIGIHSFPA